jgi:alpha-glucosidase
MRGKYVLPFPLLIAAFILISFSCNAGKRNVFPETGSIHHRLGTQTWILDSFQLHWDSVTSHLEISHLSDTTHILWSTFPGKSWLMAGEGEGYFEDKRGTFILHERIDKHPFIHQKITSIQKSDSALTITGVLYNQKGKSIPFTQVWKTTPEGHLQWHFFSDSSLVNRLYMCWQAYPDEYITGMGEQPTHFNHKGNLVPVLVQEQGIGRGDIQSWPIKLVLGPSTGNSYTTYKAVPHYISSKAQSLMLENDAYSEFDFTHPEITQIKVFDTHITGRILPGKTPAEFIESYTRYAGRMRPLPDWVHNGAIVGMQGGTEKVYSVWNKLEKAGTPITAFWLQDWVGQRKTILGQQLWWNWELDTQRYPEWKQLVDSLQKSQISVMGYINPFVVEVQGNKSEYRRNLFQEALDSGYLVTKENGQPYFNVTSFKAALLDLSDPGCRKWIKEIIKDEIIATGFRGWMADFGEALPFEVKLKNVRTTASYHNRYAQEWAQLNREAIEEAGLGEDITFFSRSAYTRSPAYATLFWQGDQMVDWGKNDGLPSALVGLLSSGLSGFAFNHSDIGGYATIDFPLGKKIIRSPELLVRWMQLSAFTIVYRTHEGLGPDKNYQVYSDPATAHQFAYWAKVHQAWKFYRDQLIKEAAEKGWPVVRPLAFLFPEDPEAWRCNHTQLMVGNELLVAPVLTPDTDSISVYLPKGEWVDAWSGEVLKSKGEYFNLKGYRHKPGIFYLKESQIGEQFSKNLAAIPF